MRTGIAAIGMVVSGVVGVLAGRWTDSAPKGDTDPGPARAFMASVVRISDGDTLELAPLDPPGPNEKVRLLGIDAPAEGKPLFKESAAALAALTKAGTIRVEFERSGPGQRDAYGRVLGYVFVGDTNANVELVRQGWSVYSNKHGGARYAAELRAAEEEARAARRGVWKFAK